MLTDAYMPRAAPLTGAQITALAKLCADKGYDFRLALKTLQRDGTPWLRPDKR
jgi:hypothetical protein